MTMDMLTVEIELPRDLLMALNISVAEVEHKAKEWMALELFREGHISGGKAAEILGLTKSQFIDLLNQREIPYLDLGSEELAKEQATAIAAMKSPRS
jgi:predicted HTH domain antitoxin